MGILSWFIVSLIAGLVAGQDLRRGGYGVMGDFYTDYLLSWREDGVFGSPQTAHASPISQEFRNP